MNRLIAIAAMLICGVASGQQTPPQFETKLKSTVVTFTRNVTFHLGGEEISVIHVEPAHTDGDSFVFFHKANVLHMGDCYLNGSYPVIDYSNGGTFTGIIAAADTGLGMLNASTSIIPGHGPLARDQDLREWRNMLATIHERIKKAVASGMNLEQINQ